MERIRAVGERVAASLGLELVDVEFRGGAGRQGRLLRVVIDKPAGVTHEDCASVSREMGTILDVEETIPGGEYMLEVSSPGLDRQLTREADFQRFVGSRVKLMTREPVGASERSKGNRHFEGRLEKFSGGLLYLDLTLASKKKQKQAGGVQHVEIELSNVEKANLVPEL